MREAVLSIYYTDQKRKLHNESQGKFYYLNGKPVFLADMTPAKWWRSFGGYSISKQILDAFSKLKIRPQIIYRLKEKAILYFTTPTVFKKKGILVPYGFHEQYVLPIHNFKAVSVRLESEPTNLPVMVLADWMKTNEFAGNKTLEIAEPVQERMFV